jgi:phage recombination protein Bet
MSEEFKVEFTPFGESKAIHLTAGMVREYLTVKTKQGHQASAADVRQFLELCAAQGLNPWTKDAVLVGFDTKDGPKFNLITSHQALLKRAEFSQHFDGIESGVIVFRGEDPLDATDETTILREGDFVHASEFLLGGWAKVFRKDRARPFSDRIHREVFDTKMSRWEKDPAGMIVKVAEGSALRKAFPSALSGLYCHEEMELLRESRIIGLTDGREEQANGKLILPDDIQQSDMIDDATRRINPAREKVPVERREKRPDEETRERVEPVREAVQDQPTGPQWPEPVTKLLGAIGRAKSEMSLLSIKQAWMQIREEHPDAVEAVEAALSRRFSEVTPMGERPK